MISEQQFQELISQPEGETLDFKSDAYDLGKEKGGREDFIKDLLCMANTPRDGSSFLILGVKKSADGSYDLKGISRQIDDADLHQALDGAVFPKPRFQYYPISLHGIVFGVVEIFPERSGPYMPIKDFEGFLRNGQIYFRSGSRNSVAYSDDIRMIAAWMTGSKAARADITLNTSWAEFRESVHDFDPLYRYVLILSRIDSVDSHQISVLGRIPWALVIDFDPDSDTSGMLKVLKPEITKTRAIHLALLGEEIEINPFRATSWLFAYGLTGRNEKTFTGTWREWKNKYAREFEKQLRAASSHLSPSPVVCIVLWESTDLSRHLYSTLESLIGALGESVEFVIPTPHIGDLHAMASDMEARLLSISLPQLLYGLPTIIDSTGLEGESAVSLPSRPGIHLPIQGDTLAWLQEDLELVHLGIGLLRPEGRDIGRDFLRGAQIEWYELGLNCDVARDLAEEVLDQIRRDVQGHRTTRINLYHSPGAGGTTVARRITWELHRKIPCAILHRYATGKTIERLSSITSLTDLPVLIIIDGAEISERQADALFDELRYRQVSAIMLQILRRFSSQEKRERASHLPTELSRAEARRFVDKYSQGNPSKRESLLQLETSHDPRQRSAFYFGLTVFERDFLALPSFVSARTADLDANGRTIMTALSFAHHYGQCPLNSQVFAPLLGIPANRALRLADALPSPAIELLTETSEGTWRTVHDLIASEILEQSLSPANQDRRLWKQNLSRFSISFIEMCSGSIARASISESILEVIRRIFIYRDNVDLMGSERAATRRFSQVLEDINSREGRLLVLKSIVESFPEEAHFWAHLGRFYSNEMRDFARAIEFADAAIRLQPSDHLLHHMKGMVLRKQMEEAIGHREPTGQLIAIARGASECFRMARELDSDDEHGYISEVQMLINLMDYASRNIEGGIFRYVSSSTSEPFIRDAFDRAENLLDQVRRFRQGEMPSGYEAYCRAKLNALYGEHDVALQSWTNLLSDREIYRPPVRRQIVRTYLVRRGGSWYNLKPRELLRSVELIEDNLQEEPYNESDLRLWLQGIRFLPTPPSLEGVLERVTYWKANKGGLEASFYLYILHSLLAMEGRRVHQDDAEGFLNECRLLSRQRRNRHRSFEWLGHGEGIRGLVHQLELGEWNEHSNFWSSVEKLKRVSGRISRIDGPQAGKIDLPGGLEAFFVPIRGNFFKGQSENEKVHFYVGFSYDGLRAWAVERI